MICERCKIREATISYTEIINGQKTEHHFCTQCAQEMNFGAASVLFDGEFPFSKLLSALSGAFSRIGLTAELGDLSVRPGEGPAPKSPADGSADSGLPEALKSALMDAVIAFLKDKA